MPEVELRDIMKRFGNVTASSDINLKIADGEYVTILGPSGCGKTTLIRMIAGIIEPTEGKVFIGGKDMEGVPIEERDIGYVFQNIALFPHLTALGNVSYGPIVKDMDRKEAEEVPRRYLELVRLLDRMAMFPNELSGGEQQKVSLARALASGARLLLLDEPLSALDARVRMDLRYELRRITKDLRLTVVHVTHDQEEAMTVSDRIVLMRNGRIVETNTPELLYLQPKDLFTANFIGETNFLEGAVREVLEDRTLVELRDGTVVEARSSQFGSGDAVVLSIRPERVHPASEGLRSVVRNITYMGTYIRIAVETDSEDRVNFDVSTSEDRDYNIGDRVDLIWSKRSGMLYPRPPEGVSEAIKLE
ncbi:MAG: ABC transporter ATP-binding protein [Methanomassiliicoccus sp.]|nr:ABC transporter ATP-binding protein [Methanomassiliicoccus sp.]